MSKEIKEVEQKVGLLLDKLPLESDLKELENIRVEFLGKNGFITALLKQMGAIIVDAEKKEFGAKVNKLKNTVQEAINTRKAGLEQLELEQKIKSQWADLSLPPRGHTPGKIHPITQCIAEVTEIFASLGFAVAQGPEIEDDFHNFDALNIPPHHPARQNHDTFYLPNNMLLRTHTSNVEIRHMLSTKPPYKIIAPGRVYRCDYDATHAPMFHQIEGLYIDKNISMANLKWTLIEFLKAFFEKDNIPVRFRPNFFPFTEPSAEVDVAYRKTKNDLVIGEGDSWLEILGCGMTHPNVLKNVGIDPDVYQGFAFGMGVERLAMLKYGVPDLRNFFDSDYRWLKHYGFSLFNIPSTSAGLSR
jgi:phenylalanyl-tRNA synthetase alpha chain